VSYVREHDNELSGFIKGGEFLDHFIKECASWQHEALAWRSRRKLSNNSKNLTIVYNIYNSLYRAVLNINIGIIRVCGM
jgi:hypothetical protein